MSYILKSTWQALDWAESSRPCSWSVLRVTQLQFSINEDSRIRKPIPPFIARASQAFQLWRSRRFIRIPTVVQENPSRYLCSSEASDRLVDEPLASNNRARKRTTISVRRKLIVRYPALTVRGQCGWSLALSRTQTRSYISHSSRDHICTSRVMYCMI